MILRHPETSIALCSRRLGKASPLYFMHIPKTAGTSLRHWLHDLFDESEWLPCHVLQELENRDRSEINRYQFFSGHFGWRLEEYLERRPDTITWLRDPVSRVASNFNYICSQYDELVGLAAECGEQGWVEFYDLCRRSTLPELVSHPDYWGYSDNLQTRYLAGISPGVERVILNDQFLELAKKNLQEMCFVGICEWMAQSIDLFCHRAKLPYRPMEFRYNCSSNHRSNWTSAELQRIQHSERFDRALYQYAQHLFTRRFGEWWRELTGQRISSIDDVQTVYGEEQTVSTIQSFLNSQFKYGESAHVDSTNGELDFSKAVFFSGWYPRSNSFLGRPIRWAGPGNRCSVFMPLRFGLAYGVEFTIRYLADYRFMQTLRVVVNGKSMPVDFQQLPERMGEPRQYRVNFQIPVEALSISQTFTEVEIQVNGQLVKMGNDENCRVSFATDGFRYWALE